MHIIRSSALACEWRSDWCCTYAPYGQLLLKRDSTLQGIASWSSNPPAPPAAGGADSAPADQAAARKRPAPRQRKRKAASAQLEGAAELSDGDVGLAGTSGQQHAEPAATDPDQEEALAMVSFPERIEAALRANAALKQRLQSLIQTVRCALGGHGLEDDICTHCQ